MIDSSFKNIEKETNAAKSIPKPSSMFHQQADIRDLFSTIEDVDEYTFFVYSSEIYTLENFILLYFVLFFGLFVFVPEKNNTVIFVEG